MADACVIDFKGMRYYYTNTNDENRDMFIKRCWFKVRNNNAEYPEHVLEMLSHAWIQITYNGVIYDDKINTLLTKCVI